jgi:hypothetical protein
VQESEGKKGGCGELLKKRRDERVLIPGRASSDAIPDVAGREDGHEAAKPNGVIQQVHIHIRWLTKALDRGALSLQHNVPNVTFNEIIQFIIKPWSTAIPQKYIVTPNTPARIQLSRS